MPKPLVAVLCLLVAVAASAQEPRPAVGVAFGGGSARGIAHVGVIQWFEEHHIPIDRAAGTSMGGLIGGGFAAGMDATELHALINSLNWDQLFGTSSFSFKNIRRKADARAYPSRLEFGIKRGIAAPPSLNNGEQIDLLVGRIAAPYFAARSFDELPTPFRAVAVDLLSASPVVLDRGSLAAAMRATMSLPLIFPPVRVDGRVLVDGGVMDNVPADVVRAMGARHVVAVNVGDLSDLETIGASMFGLAGATIDAMMRANTRVAISQADIIINVPVQDYGSLDWRRSEELITEGYNAAEAMRDRLLPLAVSDAEYARWQSGRQSRRRTALPAPAFTRFEGFSASDEHRLSDLRTLHATGPLSVEALETDLRELSGLDRYETITWRLVADPAGEIGLLIVATPKPYGPPFLMLGLNLENTTSDDFAVTITARALAYDLVGSGSELRLDATLGSDPSLGLELYKPIGTTPFFVAPYAGIVDRTLSVTADDALVAKYGETLSRIGANVGMNLGPLSDVRVGAYVGRVDAGVQIGDPGMPAADGEEVAGQAIWRYDSQDSPVVPSSGTVAQAGLRYVFNEPTITPPLTSGRTSEKMTQLAGEMSTFWTWQERNRLFVLAGMGTSFDHSPLPIDQFALGSPLRLGAYSSGEIRGDHYYLATGGYLRQIGRLPDFMGGSIYAGAWLENGDAFDDWNKMTLRSQPGFGVIMDTLIGPVILGGTAGFDGRWRTYVGVGRIFARTQWR
jgi:NTE family protein